MYTDIEKEAAFRRQWRKVFVITDEENEDFDAENEERVQNYLQDNIDILTPYHTIDLARLNNI